MTTMTTKKPVIPEAPTRAEAAQLVQEYCRRIGITREQYDAEGTLQQEQVDALWELAHCDDDDPVIPAGLPGSGKRRSDLTDEETEALSIAQMAFDELMPGTFLPIDNDNHD